MLPKAVTAVATAKIVSIATTMKIDLCFHSLERFLALQPMERSFNLVCSILDNRLEIAVLLLPKIFVSSLRADAAPEL